MTSTSTPSFSIQKRPEKELVLTQVIENTRDRSQYPRTFPIGKHMGFEFFVTVANTKYESYRKFMLHADNEFYETKQREWAFPCRISFEHGSSSSQTYSWFFLKSHADKGVQTVFFEKEDTFKFTIRVYVPDCLKTFDDPNYSDASILVDGKEFLVSKLFLCSQATYFDSAFKWAAQQGKEPKITVDTFYAFEVQRFLEVIHGDIITEHDNFDMLFEMCRFFDSPTGMRRCAQIVMYYSEMDKAEKFALADKFDVSELKVLLIGSVKDMKELKSILPKDRSNLNQNELIAFLDKAMNIHDE